MQHSQRPNFGWGRNIRWAGEQVLRDAASRDGGRYAWLNTMISRWRCFCSFCKEKQISDLKDINENLLQEYALSISHLNIATQHNYLSGVNVVMSLSSGGTWQPVSPVNLIQSRRINVRKDEKRFVLAVKFAYAFGLRRREALLLEFHHAYNRAMETGFIDIIRGTKGGRSRSVPRVLPVPAVGFDYLQEACHDFPEFCCLLLSDSYKAVSNSLSNTVLPILKEHGIKRFHDLRVDYAAFRYKQLTGYDAPINSALRADKELDKQARAVISAELGHSRPEIINAYIGSFHEKPLSNRS